MKKLIFLIYIFLSLNVFSQSPNLSEFISDLDKKEGYLNFYWDDNKGKIYLEIKNLNQELIYINYLSAGVGSNRSEERRVGKECER